MRLLCRSLTSAIDCVSALSEYEKQGEEHLKGCKIVEQEKIEDVNRQLNGTSKSLSNMFCVGDSGTDDAAERTWANYNAESTAVPPMRICPKLHKDLNEDGSPKTRAIVGASSCMAARASEVLADAIYAFSEGCVTVEC